MRSGEEAGEFQKCNWQAPAWLAPIIRRRLASCAAAADAWPTSLEAASSKQRNIFFSRIVLATRGANSLRVAVDSMARVPAMHFLPPHKEMQTVSRFGNDISVSLEGQNSGR